jgi:secondary thiamine-phosphate synthase enzyme
METLSSASICRHTRIHLSSRYPTEFIDVTDRLQDFITDAGVRVGVLNIQTLHTTTGIVVNEHEPLLLGDFQSVLEEAAPCDGRYRHDDLVLRTVNLTEAERPNGHAHCRALFLPSSTGLNVSKGRLVLGQWQRVFFVELDGPRERDVSLLAYGEAWR